MTRVRVRRERPTALALALALCVTMLVVYVLTLDLGRSDVVESMAPAPRVTRKLQFDALESWCVILAKGATREEARLLASAYVRRGAAGYVAELDGTWAVLGALYDGEKEARRIAQRLAEEDGVPAEIVRLDAPELTLRVTAPENQIDAVAGADALLRRQGDQLGQLALQLDREEIPPDSARTLCALAATEASQAAATLGAIPGASENRLCQALIGQTTTLAGRMKTLGEVQTGGTALSGMLRCVQIESFMDRRALQIELSRDA